MSETIKLPGGAFVGRQSTDFAGGTLPWELRLPDADWNKPEFLPEGERQSGNGGDKLNCVTQSNHNDLEIQLNFLILKNLLPQTHLNFLKEKLFIGADGKVNFCDKFNSILNGTAEFKGNWLYKVVDEERKNGLIPQALLSENIDDNWLDYYNPDQIKDGMKAIGKEFLKYFDISYEWINDTSPENLFKQLQHVPLQVVRPGHAIVQIKSMAELMMYFDSYSPFVKTLPQNQISDIMKIIIKPNIMQNMTFVHIAGTKSYGFLEATDYTKIVHLAVSEAHLQIMASSFGVNIYMEDKTTIDWGKAVEIKI